MIVSVIVDVTRLCGLLYGDVSFLTLPYVFSRLPFVSLSSLCLEFPSFPISLVSRFVCLFMSTILVYFPDLSGVSLCFLVGPRPFPTYVYMLASRALAKKFRFSLVFQSPQEFRFSFPFAPLRALGSPFPSSFFSLTCRSPLVFSLLSDPLFSSATPCPSQRPLTTFLWPFSPSEQQQGPYPSSC